MKNNSPLLINAKTDSNIYHNVTPETANWNYLNFEARTMQLGESWEHQTDGNEMVIVLLSGNFKVESDKGNWETINGRKDVFSGIAHTLYLPRGAKFTLEATSENLDIAYGWCNPKMIFRHSLLDLRIHRL